jgi:hypothetical protein
MRPILFEMSSDAQFEFAGLLDAGVATRLIAYVEHGKAHEMASGKRRQFSHTIAVAATFLVIGSLEALIALELPSQCLERQSGDILS